MYVSTRLVSLFHQPPVLHAWTACISLYESFIMLQVFHHFMSTKHDMCIYPFRTKGSAVIVSTASLAKWLRRPPREGNTPGSNPACAEVFPGSSYTSGLKIGAPVATLPGAWRHRVSAGTGRPGVSIL